MHHPPLIGIIGGYGPSTSALFCQHLVAHALRIRQDFAPSFIMDSIPIDFEDAGKCIGGDMDATRRLIDAANDGIRRMAAIGVRTIALPCNSVHVLFDEYAVPAGMEMLHIADPLVARLKGHGRKRIGFLSSGMTAREDIYFSRLHKAGITHVLPSADVQKCLNAEITAFVESGQVRTSTRDLFQEAIRELQAHDIEAIALACTDISGILDRLELPIPIPIEDSMDALAEECARRSMAF